MDALKDTILRADGAGYSGDQDARVDELKVCLYHTLLLECCVLYVYVYVFV